MVGIWSYNFARLTYACMYSKSPSKRTGPAINMFIQELLILGCAIASIVILMKDNMETSI